MVIPSTLNTFVLFFLICLISTPAKTASLLKPYTAVYAGTVNGINAQLQQQLKTTDNNRWQLNNTVSILFTSFEEKTTFGLDQQQVIPSNYSFKNGLRKKRNSELHFNWAANTVFDTLHSQHALNIPKGTLDKLSFQTQLRLDLMATGDQFISKKYHLVDRNKYKTYTITSLGKERINTHLGSFNAIKLEQRRPGKDKHTLIWLALDWDYFVLRVQRVEHDKPNYQVDLKQANINGEKIKSLSQPSNNHFN